MLFIEDVMKLNNYDSLMMEVLTHLCSPTSLQYKFSNWYQAYFTKIFPHYISLDMKSPCEKEKKKYYFQNCRMIPVKQIIGRSGENSDAINESLKRDFYLDILVISINRRYKIKMI